MYFLVEQLDDTTHIFQAVHVDIQALLEKIRMVVQGDVVYPLQINFTCFLKEQFVFVCEQAVVLQVLQNVCESVVVSYF